MPAAIVWFRQDLRLADNPALHAALRSRGAVIPVYIRAPHEEGHWRPGAASRWWLHHALNDLDAQLRRRGSRLIVRAGDSLTVLKELVQATGAERVVWNRRYEPAAVERDSHVESELTATGVQVEICNGSLLFDPHAIRTRTGGPFQVFTPFWNACMGLEHPGEALPAPRNLPAPKRWPSSFGVEKLALLPGISWADEIAQTWVPGEQAGLSRLKAFCRKGLSNYAALRNRPDTDGTSRLSPYLHWGHISPRQVWHAASGAGGEEFLRQIGWREFAHYLLVHFPHTTDASLRPTFEGVRWSRDDRLLKAWQRGRTGYPLVDAGMRQLWRTGWMHNRVRMVVASFLVKHLLFPWQAGARWFWDTLVDADLANNTLGWQWSAGCGADAAPYFRVFNPAAQAEKFDTEGKYVRRWVPEASVGMGRYVPPIVDHAAARRRFLEQVRHT